MTPVLKKGDKSQTVNYRPISLTCIHCKVLEHIMTKRNSVEYRHNDGGVTGQADAVTFELMKEALLVYFGNEKGDFKCKITESKDKDGNCVQKQSRFYIPTKMTHIQ